MDLSRDVHVFVTGRKDPLLATSRIELSTASSMMRDIFLGLKVCDGCKEPMSIIIADEEEKVVTAAFSKVLRKRGGLTIIQGKHSKLCIISIT